MSWWVTLLNPLLWWEDIPWIEVDGVTILTYFFDEEPISCNIEYYPLFILMMSLEAYILFVRIEIMTRFECLSGNLNYTRKKMVKFMVWCLFSWRNIHHWILYSKQKFEQFENIFSVCTKQCMNKIWSIYWIIILWHEFVFNARRDT